MFRVGGRFTPSPGQIGLVSAIYTDREDSDDLIDPDFGQVEDERAPTSASSRPVFGRVRAFAAGRRRGLGRSDGRCPRVAEDGVATSSEERRDHGRRRLSDRRAWRWARRSIWPAPGLRRRRQRRQRKSPQRTARLAWRGLTPGHRRDLAPCRAVRLRAAGGRTIKRPFVANQTLQPTQLAGFNEQFDDLDGTRADWLGLAVDIRASDSVRVGARCCCGACRVEVALIEAAISCTSRNSSATTGPWPIYIGRRPTGSPPRWR